MREELIQRADSLQSQFKTLADAGIGLLEGPDNAVPPWIKKFVQLCATCTDWISDVRTEKQKPVPPASQRDSCFDGIQAHVHFVVHSYHTKHHDITEDMVKQYIEKCRLLSQNFRTWISREKEQKTGNPYCVRSDNYC